jgi:hypothetical protein
LWTYCRNPETIQKRRSRRWERKRPDETSLPTSGLRSRHYFRFEGPCSSRLVTWASQMGSPPQMVGYIRPHLRTQKTARTCQECPCLYKISPPHCVPADVPVMYGIRARLLDQNNHSLDLLTEVRTQCERAVIVQLLVTSPPHGIAHSLYLNLSSKFQSFPICDVRKHELCLPNLAR